MPSLKDLQLKEDQIAGGDWADLPEQLGAFADPPQPGHYRLRFPPAGPLSESWDVFDAKVGQRIVSKLQGEAALTVVHAANQKYINEPLETRISNAERKRGKDDNKVASDMDYALIALKYQGKRPKTNREYIDAFQSVAPNKEIRVDWEFSWFCNDNKPARINDPANGMQVLDGKDGRPDQKGCGTRYYQKDVEKQANEKTGEMEYPVRITCSCGAEVRAFGQISRFLPVE